MSEVSHPLVIGQVDRFEGPFLTGWAIREPDSANCQIVVRDGCGVIVSTGRATREREDLRVLGRGRANFAFRVPIPDNAVGELRVYADGEELPGSPVVVGKGIFDGNLDVSRGVISGTITERTNALVPPEIEIHDQWGRRIAVLQSQLLAEPILDFPAATFRIPIPDAYVGAGEVHFSASVNGSKFAEAEYYLGLLGVAERVSPDRCSGWLFSRECPARRFTINIFKNGELAGTATANQARVDVASVHPGFADVGFDIPLDPSGAGDDGFSIISIRIAGGDSDILGSPFATGRRRDAVPALRRAAQRFRRVQRDDLAAEDNFVIATLRTALAAARVGPEFVTVGGHLPPARELADSPRLNIVIPIYRGVEITRECIDTVLTERCDRTDHLVLINDSSPETAMQALLDSYRDLPGVHVLTNSTNLGFIGTVNRGLRFCRSGDVLILNSDTRVMPGALDEMVAVAHRSPEIGTVTALSNNATIFSYPHPQLPSVTLTDADWKEIAEIFATENAGRYVEVPTGHGFCMLIKRSMLDEVGILNEVFGRGYGEENELCLRAADVGYIHVAAAGAFVEHRESVSFGEEKDLLISRNIPLLEQMFPEYTANVIAYEARDGLRVARWPVDRHRIRKARASGSRFILTITNSLGGGTRTAATDIELTGVFDDFSLIYLRCVDDMMFLEAEEPLLRAVFQEADLDALFCVLEDADVSLVLAHQLLGYSEAFIRKLSSWIKSRNCAIYAHDYYALCPRVTLIDALDEFCGAAPVAVCQRCLALGGSHESSRMDRIGPDEHRRLFADLFANATAVIAPSSSTAELVRAVFPERRIEVLPHPGIVSHYDAPASGGSYDDVVLLGAVGRHKGSHHLIDIARRASITHPDLRFHVVGYTDVDDELKKLANVSVTGPYTAESLRMRVTETGARIALFLHGWPETFSYTLSEALELGLIPVAPNLGAPAERMRQLGVGRIFSYPFTAGDVLRVLAEFKDDETAPAGEGHDMRVTGWAALFKRLCMEPASVAV